MLERWLFLNPEHARSGQLPTKAEKATLSGNCGVEVRKLEYWFWNRNQQVKRDFTRKGGPSGPQQPTPKAAAAAAAGSARAAVGKTSIKAAPPETLDAGNAGKREGSPEAGNRDSRSRPLMRLFSDSVDSSNSLGNHELSLGARKRQRVDELAVATAERFRASGGSVVAKVRAATRPCSHRC